MVFIIFLPNIYRTYSKGVVISSLGVGILEPHSVLGGTKGIFLNFHCGGLLLIGYDLVKPEVEGIGSIGLGLSSNGSKLASKPSASISVFKFENVLTSFVS